MVGYPTIPSNYHALSRLLALKYVTSKTDRPSAALQVGVPHTLS